MSSDPSWGLSVYLTREWEMSKLAIIQAVFHKASDKDDSGQYFDAAILALSKLGFKLAPDVSGVSKNNNEEKPTPINNTSEEDE